MARPFLFASLVIHMTDKPLVQINLLNHPYHIIDHEISLGLIGGFLDEGECRLLIAGNDFALKTVMARIQKLFPDGNLSPAVLWRYETGQDTPEDVDYLVDDQLLDAPQRIWTCRISLNQGFEGGQTAFPAPSVRIEPRTGRLLFWRNVDDQDNGLPQCRHAEEPVESGTKYQLVVYVRRKPSDL